MHKSLGIWNNFKTGKDELFEGFPPDERLSEFIPQIAPALNMYNVLLEMGKTPQEALLQVLDACTRKSENKR